VSSGDYSTCVCTGQNLPLQSTKHVSATSSTKHDVASGNKPALRIICICSKAQQSHAEPSAKHAAIAKQAHCMLSCHSFWFKMDRLTLLHAVATPHASPHAVLAANVAPVATPAAADVPVAVLLIIHLFCLLLGMPFRLLPVQYSMLSLTCANKQCKWRSAVRCTAPVRCAVTWENATSIHCLAAMGCSSIKRQNTIQQSLFRPAGNLHKQRCI